jgi:hypothetical protein
MTEEKEWVRLGGKDGVYLVEGEDYTVDRDAGLLKINEKAWAKVPAKCIKLPDLLARIADLEKRNADLEARVAALQDIAIEEKAQLLCPVTSWEDVPAREYFRAQANWQLLAEHPEAFR